MNIKRLAAVCTTLLFFAAPSAMAKSHGGTESTVSAFPAEWLEATPELYPISQQPAPVQWQAWLTVQIAAAKSRKPPPILIEAHGASKAVAEKILRYLVDHHKFPENRFIVAERRTDDAWKGWITVRPEGVSLPAQAPSWELPVVRTSLASPMSPEEAARLYQYSDTRQNPEIASSRVSFRPGIGLQWFNLETDPRRPADRWQASWLGVRASGETALARTGAYEFGLSGSYFTSLTGLDEASVSSRITVADGGGYALANLEPSVLGLVQLRMDMGFFGNWRDREDRSQFAPPVRAAQLKLGASTTFDDAIRMGASLGYAFSERGVWQAGGALSHRIFASSARRWDLALAMTLSLARFDREGGSVQESWSAIQVGVSGAL